MLIFLDDFDTPLLTSYAKGYWSEMYDFLHAFFISTFKDNPSLDRALLTGITSASVFPELNHMQVVIISNRYETSFGFTQEEVDRALKEYHLSDQKEMVRWLYL